MYERLGEDKGRAIIASSRTDERSWVLAGQENSLFTHFLLLALRGFAPTRGDGFIRLFDIFDYVSGQVVSQRSDQHLVLKAELENNFPIALFQAGVKFTLNPTDAEGNAPDLQNYRHLPISPVEAAVLRKMFIGYERLVIKEEFGGGFGGGRVFLVRPIATTKAELLTVLKLGPALQVKQEWSAFTRFIRHQMTSVAQIEGEPVYSEDDAWGGVRYRLAGDGRFHTESLRTYSHHAAVQDLVYPMCNF